MSLVLDIEKNIIASCDSVSILIPAKCSRRLEQNLHKNLNFREFSKFFQEGEMRNHSVNSGELWLFFPHDNI